MRLDDSPSPRQILERQRRLVGWGVVAAFWLAVLWFVSPGLPVLFGPSASAAVREAGRELFVHEWSPNDPLAKGDGLGPVFNAKSCAACHFQGGIGGGGGAAQNVHNFLVLPNRGDTVVREGTVHAYATLPELRESLKAVRNRHTVVKGSTRVVEENHCRYTVTVPDFDPVHGSIVQPTALFGAGWIDRIASKAITQSLMSQAIGNAAKEFQLDFSAVPPGRVRKLADGRVGRFGWKAQFATLEEFVAAACANELGLGTPLTEQVRPFARPNHPAATADLDQTQFAALVAFVDTLPKPIEVTPNDSVAAERAVRGKHVFAGIGCVACHVPDMGGVKGVYSDFLLHEIDDPGRGNGGYGDLPDGVTLPDGMPKESEWKTPPLWGVADSAPYLHDGSAATLRDAILRHKGDAKAVTAAFVKLQRDDQTALIAFLNTLKAPPDVSVAKK